MLNRNARQVNLLETANIDRGHPIALWISAFSVRVNATGLAKAVLNNVLVERVCADVFFCGKQLEFVARHKPEERSFARTYRAIARHRPIEFAFYLERYFATVTATLVLHLGSP
jgi:hypothetical protein